MDVRAYTLIIHTPSRDGILETKHARIHARMHAKCIQKRGERQRFPARSASKGDRDYHSDVVNTFTPKRISSGQLYSEGAPGTPSGTSRRARDKLISAFSCNLGMFIFFTLFPSLAHPRNAKVGRAGLMKAAKMGG